MRNDDDHLRFPFKSELFMSASVWFYLPLWKKNIRFELSRPFFQTILRGVKRRRSRIKKVSDIALSLFDVWSTICTATPNICTTIDATKGRRVLRWRADDYNRHKNKENMTVSMFLPCLHRLFSLQCRISVVVIKCISNGHKKSNINNNKLHLCRQS